MYHKTDSKLEASNVIINSRSSISYSNPLIRIDKHSEKSSTFKESAFVVEWQMQNRNSAISE